MNPNGPRKTKERGTALVEGVIALLGLMIAIPSVLIAILYLSSSLWLDHCLYEGLICAAEKSISSNCRLRTERCFKDIFPFSTKFSIRLHPLGNRKVSGSAEVKLTEQIKIRSKELLTLPRGSTL